MAELQKEEQEIIEKMAKVIAGITELNADTDAEDKEQKLKDLNDTMVQLATNLMTAKTELAKIPKDEVTSVTQASPEVAEIRTSPSISSGEIPDHSDRVSVLGKLGGSMTVKPPRFKKEGDIWIFLDRFEQYLKLSGDHDTGSVEFLMLSLVEDDKMYRKLKTTFLSIPTSDRQMRTPDLMTAIRSGLYPGAESRTLRDAMSQMKQRTEESAEDYTMRIEVEAAKAFSPLEEAVKNEACLSALSNGLRSLDIRHRIKETEVKNFDKAARLAVKLEHIYKTTPEHIEQDEITSFGVLAVNNNTGISSTNTRNEPSSGTEPIRRSSSESRNFNPHQNLICHNCHRHGHLQRNCRSPPTGRFRSNNNHRESYRRDGGNVHIQCYECGGRGHYANRCPNRSSRPNALNANTTGHFPAHPSRQN